MEKESPELINRKGVDQGLDHAHNWFNELERRYPDLTNDLPEGRSSTVMTEYNISAVRLMERSLGAETVLGLGMQTAGSPECVARTDAHGLTAAARLTLRGTPYTHTRAEPDTTERGSKEH
ncbi:hypothetical protein EVAR_65607_1 [Eumeta japonica]|uniref:Uncharacterized protein n=1 Tax=Eumeta variegata TaxID=151549 RepID=A0A4C1ZQK5_EUMVA|nr:hypothetical protein EVAR_65607_1 [Eumeta japonica]